MTERRSDRKILFLFFCDSKKKKKAPKRFGGAKHPLSRHLPLTGNKKTERKNCFFRPV